MESDDQRMIRTFSQYTPPAIHFGAGKFGLVPELIRRFGKRALILTGSGSVKKTEAWRQLERALAPEPLSIIWETVTGEPSPAIVDRITRSNKEPLPDVVIAIGGGSVMDAGKAVSAMLRYDEPAEAFLEGVGTKTHDGRKVPFIAVPTTSGTGSEATKNAVLSRVGPDGFKKSLRHDRLVPDVAVVDPQLTRTCPPPLTAACGMDAFTQLLESYVSTAATPFTDALAFSGLQAVARSLEQAVQNGEDIAARSDMAYASMISGITLANAGLGLVHGLASSIGGFCHIPHGIICGTLMAPCMEFTIRHLLKYTPDNPAVSKFAETGKLFSPETGKSRPFYCESLVATLYALSDRLGLTALSRNGFNASLLDAVIARTEPKNNPVKLTPDEWREILLSRLK